MQVGLMRRSLWHQAKKYSLCGLFLSGLCGLERAKRVGVR
jgi:hypothetical protein